MIKGILDWGSIAIAAGTLVKLLPAIAALWTIAWLSISMWESKTVRGWRKRGKVTQEDKVDTPSVPLYVGDDDHLKGEWHEPRS